MSRIPELGRNLEHLSKVLSSYYDDLDEIENILALNGKSIVQAEKDQANQYRYEKSRAELKAIVKYIQSYVNSVRGKLFQTSVESYSYEISDRARDRYIDSNADFIAANELLIEVEEVYDKFSAICEAFKTRGYALKDVTTLYVNSLQERIL